MEFPISSMDMNPYTASFSRPYSDVTSEILCLSQKHQNRKYTREYVGKLTHNLGTGSEKFPIVTRGFIFDNTMTECC